MELETKQDVREEVKKDVKEELVKTKMATALSEREPRDLGFGSIVSRESRLRLINTDGSFNVQRKGLAYISSLNFFHVSLSMSWTKFLGIVLILYFFSNVLFGLLYTLCGANALVDSSSTPLSSQFLRAFFFSVQTFATIGYGTIHPVGVLPNFLVMIESYYSLLVNALIIGLVFARFARPTAMIKFSENAIVAPYRGGQSFMFRLVNMRASQLIEVNIKVMMSHFVEEGGSVIRRFDSLELERSNVSFFPLSWTIVHPIDEASPLFNLTNKDLEKSDAEFLILLTAIDETFAQPVHTRSSYKPSEVVWNAKFVNLYRKVQNDEPISIDVRKLSSIEMVTE
jgi:inward rectifier potassium channel